MHNTVYGNQLLKYINDKNISNIQLTKKSMLPGNLIKTLQYMAAVRECLIIM